MNDLTTLAPSDQQLLLELDGHPDQALRELMRRYGDFVRSCCHRQLGEYQADDAAQAVFLVLHAKARDAGRSPVLSAWLYRVAINICQNARRAQHRRTQAERSAMDMQPSPSTHGHQEVLPELDQALAALPAGQRDAIILRYLRAQDDHLSAQELGCSQEALRVRISRGLDRLRLLLSRRGITISVLALVAFLSNQASGMEGAASFTAISPTARRLAHEQIAKYQTQRHIRLVLGVVLSALVAIALVLTLEHSSPRTSRTPVPAQAKASGVTPAPDEAIAEAHPGRFLPPDVTSFFVYHDLQRSHRRFLTSPYATLLTSPCQSLLQFQYGRLFSSVDLPSDDPTASITAAINGGPELTVPLLESLGTRRIVWGMRLREPAGPHPSLRDRCEYTFAIDAPGNMSGVESLMRAKQGDFFRIGKQMLVSNRDHEVGAPPVSSKLPEFIDSAADFEVGERLLSPNHGIPRWQHSTSTLEANGLRGRVLETAVDVDPHAVWRVRRLDLNQFNSLPSDTIAAFARSFDGSEVALPRWMDSRDAAFARRMGRTQPDLLMFPQFIPDVLLPNALPQRVRLTGDCLVFCRMKNLRPILTMAAAMDAASAQACLDALAAQPSGQRIDAKSARAPLLIGEVEASYVDGRLIATSDPIGISSYLQQKPGFTQYPEIRQALAEVPQSGTYAMVVARSAACIPLLATLGTNLKQVRPQDAPSVALLPEVLRNIASGCYELMFKTADVGRRESIGTGIVAGYLAGLIDFGNPPVSLVPN